MPKYVVRNYFPQEYEEFEIEAENEEEALVSYGEGEYLGRENDDPQDAAVVSVDGVKV